MKTSYQNKFLYVSPTCQEISVSTVTVMCASNTGIEPIGENEEQYTF